MVGSRVGSKSRFVGSIVGSISDDEGGSSDPFAGIDRDATSNIYVPANSSQWVQLINALSLSISPPSSLWLCQEAAGNLADSIGALTLSAVGTPVYQQAVAGWSRKGVAASADGAGDRFQLASGVGPNPTTTSQLWLALTLMPATPAAIRFHMGLNVVNGTNSLRLGHLLTTGFPRIQIVGVTADGANSVSTEFHANVVKFDRANSVANVYTNDEKVVGVYSALVNDGAKGFCNASLAKVVYACMWQGSDAENITDAQLKSLLQGMGFTIAWS